MAKVQDIADDRYTRTRLLIGDEALERLKCATVMVIGLGGVGGACLEALARGGIGHLIVVDFDTVEPSNLNRQVLAYHSTLGQLKVDVARAMVADIASDTEVETIAQRIEPQDVPALLETPPDYVIDAQDTVATKVALAVFCENNGIPLISAMGAGKKLHPELFEITDIYNTSVDPLCKTVRKELRNRDVSALTVLYSPEAPHSASDTAPVTNDEDEDLPVSGVGRPPVGTVSYMPPIAGLMLAGYVIRSLAGID